MNIVELALLTSLARYEAHMTDPTIFHRSIYKIYCLTILWLDEETQN